MAVVRARSSPPYGLFAAVTFAVIATAAAVIFYVMWSKSLEEHDTAVASLAKIAGPNDQRILSNLLGNNYDERNTAVSQLNAMVAKLNADLAQARVSITDLTKTVEDNKVALASFTAQAKSANDRGTTAVKSMGEQQKAFDTLVGNLQNQIKTLQEQVAAANAARDQAVESGQDALNKQKQDAEDERRKLVLSLEDAQSQITHLNQQIVDLRLRITNFGSGKSDVSVGEPDGKVLRVNGATDEVYINLGRKDHITPGMPFTAYDPRVGVRFGTDAAAMGNGSLEVIQVGENTSICRITRTTPNHAIQADDLIANLVYHNDRTRKFRFTVFGDFDLDGDGVSTAAERDRLISLIKSWGGEVDDTVTSQTDYLVLGAKPKGPLVEESTDTTAPANAPAGVTGSVTDTRTQDQQRYDDLEVAAKRLGIPVLNQNRFLAMVGYYNTSVVRY